jgi:hypothetical protein
MDLVATFLGFRATQCRRAAGRRILIGLKMTQIIKSKDVIENYEFVPLPVGNGICIVAMKVDANGVRRVGDVAIEMSLREAADLAQNIIELLDRTDQGV